MARSSTVRRVRGSERSRNGVSERLIMGVPERFMRPRLILFAAVFALTAFGLLMIFSSSSITSLISADDGNNPYHFFQNQLIFAVAGVVLAFALFKSDYHLWCGRLRGPVIVAMCLMLAAILFTSAGTNAYGASRWVQFGPVSLQPSEFAKIAIIIVGASILAQRPGSWSDLSRDERLALIFGIVLPIILILKQPDKGTVIICGVTLLVMAYLSGVPTRDCAIALGLALALIIALSLRDDYSRQRIVTMLNPFLDKNGAGYQLVQGFYALGSGGLFGVGIGMGRQKYSYLPMAYNDFIYAVIGEECGLLGTVGVLVGFAAILVAGFKIAQYAPDLTGRLIAGGCSTMLFVQMLVNVCGVIGLIPLSGKPIPFISYGGSSVVSSLMLVGLIGSVSKQSSLPLTEYERRRSDWSVTASPAVSSAAMNAETHVGVPTRRSERSQTTAAVSSPPTLGNARRPTLTVLGGGAETTQRGERGARSNSPEELRRQRRMEESHHVRVTTDADGHRRIDLGPDGSERLWSERGSGRQGKRGDSRGR